MKFAFAIFILEMVLEGKKKIKIVYKGQRSKQTNGPDIKGYTVLS